VRQNGRWRKLQINHRNGCVALKIERSRRRCSHRLLSALTFSAPSNPTALNVRQRDHDWNHKHSSRLRAVKPKNYSTNLIVPSWSYSCRTKQSQGPLAYTKVGHKHEIQRAPKNSPHTRLVANIGVLQNEYLRYYLYKPMWPQDINFTDKQTNRRTVTVAIPHFALRSSPGKK